MKTLFNDKMSSAEAQRIFFDYVVAHKGENVEAVKDEYRKVSRLIVKRERKENVGKLTSYSFE